MSRARFGLVALIFVAGASSKPALAEGSGDKLAEALFREGKKLMNERDYQAACAKLSESERLDPGSGTLITLALCHEAEGRVATAWAEFNESLAVAIKDGRADRKAVAQAHVAALEPRLSRITISVAKEAANTPSLDVRLDDVTMAPASWDVATPVDPGAHHVAARAPGRVDWQTDLELSTEGASQTVTVPPLDVAPMPAATPVPTARANAPLRTTTAVADSPEPRPKSSGSTLRRVAMDGAAVIGVVGLGVGTWAGIAAIHDSRDADRRCPNSACPDAGAVSLNHDAKTRADIATVSFVVGAVGLGAAAYLFISHLQESPSAPSSAFRGGTLRLGPMTLDVGLGPTAVAAAAW